VDSYGQVKYRLSLDAPGVVGKVTQFFEIPHVEGGTYHLVITKAAHLSHTVTGLTIATGSTDSFDAGTQTLLCGDINKTPATVGGDGTVLLPDGREEIPDKKGAINSFDLAVILEDWNKYGESSDLNGDGVTNITDLNIILANWNKTKESVPWK